MLLKLIPVIFLIYSSTIYHMYNQVNHIAHLNDQITVRDDEIRRVREENTRHIAHINNLETQIAQLRNDNTELLDQIGQLERRNDEIRGTLRKLKPTRHYKPYTQLASKVGRQHRKREYRNIFDNVLEPMSDISRANISVKLGDDNVNFVWKRPQAQDSDDDDDEETLAESFDVTQSDIFDTQGNYVKPFLRSIIYVMDKHKISHDAYHETRMVTKGFMPPIHLIRQEKSNMSEEIEYIKHPTVCIYNF